ncbi:hypothetical protein [Helicobacter cinaedi]|nr:hypothetical protein [Helicobacter cinaedi]
MLGEQGGDSSQEPPIVEPESPQEQEPTISAEMRAEARKLQKQCKAIKHF